MSTTWSRESCLEILLGPLELALGVACAELQLDVVEASEEVSDEARPLAPVDRHEHPPGRRAAPGAPRLRLRATSPAARAIDGSEGSGSAVGPAAGATVESGERMAGSAPHGTAPDGERRAGPEASRVVIASKTAASLVDTTRPDTARFSRASSASPSALSATPAAPPSTSTASRGRVRLRARAPAASTPASPLHERGPGLPPESLETATLAEISAVPEAAAPPPSPPRPPATRAEAVPALVEPAVRSARVLARRLQVVGPEESPARMTHVASSPHGAASQGPPITLGAPRGVARQTSSSTIASVVVPGAAPPAAPTTSMAEPFDEHVMADVLARIARRHGIEI